LVPVGESGWVLRPYGFDDAFKGSIRSEDTFWMGMSFQKWCASRMIGLEELLDDSSVDIQFADLFPVLDSLEKVEQLLSWMIGAQTRTDKQIRELYLSSKRMSADAISTDANLGRLFKQQKQLLTDSLPILARNSDRSVSHKSTSTILQPYSQIPIIHCLTLIQILKLAYFLIFAIECFAPMWSGCVVLMGRSLNKKHSALFVKR
jgi:hypothetical protein